MPDIDFLSNQKAGESDQPKSKDKRNERLVWSEPADKKPIPKESAFSVLSFLSKKKEAKKTKEPAEKLRPTIDRNKIRESRQEILKLIKNSENQGLGEKTEKTAPGYAPAGNHGFGEKGGKNFLASLLEKYKKQPSRKEVLIDYQQVFDQEKSKRNQFSEKAVPSAAPVSPDSAEPILAPARQAQSAPAKPIVKPPEKEKGLAAIKPEKAPSNGFFSNFLKFINDIISALSKPKVKTVKVIRPEVAKGAAEKIRPEIAPAPRLKAMAGEKRGNKIKEKPLEQSKPVQIDKEATKVLETNLIKGEIVTFFDWRKKSITLINVILIPVFLVALICLGLVFYQKQSQARIQDQVQKANELKEKTKQAGLGLKEIIEFQSKLRIVSQIFAKHIYWTNFFKFLEENTIKDIFYADFAGDTSGNYSLEAMASKYSDLSEQIDSLRNNQKIVEADTVGGESVASEADNKARVKFNLNFSVLKSLFTE